MSKQEADSVNVTTGDTVLEICQTGCGIMSGEPKAGR